MKVEFERRRQKAVVFVALLLFQLLLVFLQIWLFVMVLEHLIAGNYEPAVPAALASLGIMGINIWMLRGVMRLTE